MSKSITLWNIAMNNIHLSLKEVGLKVIVYTDDLARAIRGSFCVNSGTYFTGLLLNNL